MVIIDTVYQRVLALANKEQRGYITPIEFNLLANQAQMLIFEQYFYDLDQAKRVGSEESSYSDMEELIKNKLTAFTSQELLLGTPSSSAGGTFPPNYRIGRIFVNGYTAKKVDVNTYKHLIASKFHSEGLSKSPIYIEFTSGTGFAGNADIRVFPGGFSVVCEVITRPLKVEWGYNVISEKALYNASSTTNFQLHDSEETELVYKILALAGITLNKVGLAQTAVGLDNAKIQQEKS